MTTEKENFDVIGKFIARLEELRKREDFGTLAKLRRASGTTLGEDASAMQVFYSLVPYDLKWEKTEQMFYLVGTLFDINRHPVPETKDDRKNLGVTMREYNKKANKNTSSDTGDDAGKRLSSTEKRFLTLVDSTIETGLAHRLRQVVKLADSKDVGVDWRQLLKDLLAWDHPTRYVQRSWIKACFGQRKSLEELKLDEIETE